MIHSHSRAGYSYGQTSSGGISSTAAVFAITKDTTNSAQSTKFPNSCNIQSIEVELSEISATSGITINAYLTRDSGKLAPVTPGATSGATQSITYTDISGSDHKGGVVFAVNIDYHYDSSVSNVAEGTIYCVLATNTGTATGKIRINWRA
jgi:hypothetical protein